MKLNSWKIGGSIIAVETTDDDEVDGLYLHNEKRIKISTRSTKNNSSTIDVLLHELMHAIFDFMNCDFKNTESEDLYAEKIAQVAKMVLFDNASSVIEICKTLQREKRNVKKEKPERCTKGSTRSIPSVNGRSSKSKK